MRKWRSESAFWIPFLSGLELQISDSWHDQKIAQIRVSCPAKMRVRKADDLFVVVLVTGTIAIGFRIIFSTHQIRLLVGIRRKLHRPERYSRTRICMSHL